MTQKAPCTHRTHPFARSQSTRTAASRYSCSQLAASASFLQSMQIHMWIVLDGGERVAFGSIQLHAHYRTALHQQLTARDAYNAKQSATRRQQQHFSKNVHPCPLLTASYGPSGDPQFPSALSITVRTGGPNLPPHRHCHHRHRGPPLAPAPAHPPPAPVAPRSPSATSDTCGPPLYGSLPCCRTPVHVRPSHHCMHRRARKRPPTLSPHPDPLPPPPP